MHAEAKLFRVDGGDFLQVMHQRGHLDAAIGLALVGSDGECIFPGVHVFASAFGICIAQDYALNRLYYYGGMLFCKDVSGD